jgi:hypothetical protein
VERAITGEVEKQLQRWNMSLTGGENKTKTWCCEGPRLVATGGGSGRPRGTSTLGTTARSGRRGGERGC